MNGWRSVTMWAIASLIAFFALSFLLPWTPLNCQHQDVDIRTGRIRYTRYLLFCKISERIEDSPISRVLPAEMVAITTPEWHRVNTFSPGVFNSPHYSFHGAVSEIYSLESLWQVSQVYDFSFPEELKTQTARHLLALWQHAGDYFLAKKYIQCLSDLYDDPKRPALLKSLQTLQMPLIETNGNEIVRTVFFPNGKAMDRVHGHVNLSGKFIRHGIWERWQSDGTLSLYAHFENDELHDRRFHWNEDGSLNSIDAFDHGELSEYKSTNLEQDPDYGLAQQLMVRDKDKAAHAKDDARPARPAR